MPSSFHAVLWIDHRTARILQFDAEHVQVDTVRTHQHPGRMHPHGEQSEQAFFNEVCDSLEGIAEILVVGPQTGLTDFKIFAEKKRPQTADRLVAFEPMGQATDGQLVAKAREFFVRYDQMAGISLQQQ